MSSDVSPWFVLNGKHQGHGVACKRHCVIHLCWFRLKKNPSWPPGVNYSQLLTEFPHPIGPQKCGSIWTDWLRVVTIWVALCLSEEEGEAPALSGGYLGRPRACLWTFQVLLCLLSYCTHFSLVDKHLAKKKGLGIINENEEKCFPIQAFQTQLPLLYWSRTLGMILRIRSPGLLPSWETVPTGDFLGSLLLTGNMSWTL